VDCEWEERLQDWLDGDIDASESQLVSAHAATCPTCGERLAALRALDDQLSVGLPPVALGQAFNRRVLAATGLLSRDTAAPARLEREWQQQKTWLLRGRRRIFFWVSIDILAVAALVALVASFGSRPISLAWLGRLMALAPHPGWYLLAALAALSSVAALSIVRVLATTELGEI
jgi:anti-sigma factor RsiW